MSSSYESPRRRQRPETNNDHWHKPHKPRARIDSLGLIFIGPPESGSRRLVGGLTGVGLDLSPTRSLAAAPL